ncbi:MAG TPA: hypothetical protein VFN63_05240 [Pseudolabrys sp.]|nr:hypothetical protein [Pseudolabrys sp.]
MYSGDSTGETENSLVPNVGLFGWALREVSIGIHHLRGSRLLAERAKAGHQPVTRQRREGSRQVAMFWLNWTFQCDSRLEFSDIKSTFLRGALIYDGGNVVGPARGAYLRRPTVK